MRGSRNVKVSLLTSHDKHGDWYMVATERHQFEFRVTPTGLVRLGFVERANDRAPWFPSAGDSEPAVMFNDDDTISTRIEDGCACCRGVPFEKKHNGHALSWYCPKCERYFGFVGDGE